MKAVVSTVFRSVAIVAVWSLITLNPVNAQETTFSASGNTGGVQLRCGEGHGPWDLGFVNFIINRLDLTDEQESQIRSIFDEECAGITPFISQLETNRQELQAATQNGAFNEQDVRTLATRQGEIMAELIVAKERTKSRVYSLLTDEQRTKAEQMKPGSPPPAR